MIPEGWKREPLINVAKIQTGIAKGKQGLKDPVELPYLRVANVQDGHINLSEVKTLMVERSKIARFSLMKGDVLMTEGGDFDKLGRGDVWQGQIEPCLHQNHVFCVRPDMNKLLPYFLSSLSGSSYGKFYFLSCAKRSTNLASINSTQLKEFPVLLPPLPEQKKIAQILSTWDKAIESVERLIENSWQKKKALMQQVLTGKKRFPGFDGGWQEVSIKEMGVVISGGTPATDKDSYWGGDVLWATPTDITALESRFITDTKRKITTQGLDESSAKLMPKGSLLVCTRATVGEMAISTCDISTNQGFKNLSPNDKFNAEFLYYLFGYNKHQFIRYACGSTFLELSKKDFEKRLFIVPNTEEQQKIASVLSTADREIETWKQELEHLKQEKKALMQQLLTGKRRV